MIELIHAIVAKGVHHIADKIHGGQVGDTCVGTFDDDVAYRVNEVGLAEAHRTVDQERIVCLAGVFGDLDRGGAGKLIGFPLDERRELEP